MKNIYSNSTFSVSFQKAEKSLYDSLFALFALTVHAQVGIGTITPDGSAQLEISSPNKGLLIPRVLEAARTLLIPNPATGSARVPNRRSCPWLSTIMTGPPGSL
jgi:hypothetical protein